MATIKIKPLSVNEAWQGKRFKTKKYQTYEKTLLWLLPKMELPPPPYQINLIFGFSNMASDIDNPVKNFVDVLSKRYKFNDKLIMKAIIEKRKVAKGKEFITFDITTYTENHSPA